MEVPSEIVILILSFLPRCSYKSFASTCKQFNAIFWGSVKQLSISPNKHFEWKCLEKAKKIQSIEFVEHEVLRKPEAWSVISTLSTLKTLSIWGEFPRHSFDGDAFQHLARLTYLETLSIRYYVMDNLEFLTSFGRLKRLYLFLVSFTNGCSQTLSKLTSLEHLSLWSSTIKDETCETLSALSNLETLDLSYNPLSDNGIQCFTRLTKLSQLDLVETRVTSAGVLKLQQSLPNLQITELPGNPLGASTRRLELLKFP